MNIELLRQVNELPIPSEQKEDVLKTLNKYGYDFISLQPGQIWETRNKDKVMIVETIFGWFGISLLGTGYNTANPEVEYINWKLLADNINDYVSKQIEETRGKYEQSKVI